MKETHNPQNLTPEQFGGPEGFRLLSVEEAATLTDKASARSHIGRVLLAHLAPQFYAESSCRWQSVDPAAIKPELSETLSYRTLAPELQEQPAPENWDIDLDSFASGINQTVDLCHDLAVAAGWHTDLLTGQRVPVNVAEKLLLIHSEISEACEGFRKNLPDDKLPHRAMVEVELANAAIRIFDLAGAMGLDLGGAIVEKLAYNRNRADHKPEARKEANGKRF